MKYFIIGFLGFSLYLAATQDDCANLHKPTEAPVPERQTTTLPLLPVAPSQPVESELEQTTEPLPVQPVATKRAYYPETPLPGPPAYVEPANQYAAHLIRDHYFDAKYVNALNAQQRFSLHTDAHNGVVREQFAVYGNKPLAMKFFPPVRVTEPIVIKVAKLPTAIKWVSEKEAKASPKPDWYHVTRSKGCPHCVIADGFLATPMLVGASQDFDCVKIVDPDPQGEWVRYYAIRYYPSDRFVRADSHWPFYPIDGRPSSTASYLRQLHAVKNWTEGVKTPKVTPVEKIRSLLPTLAVNEPPRTRNVVEGQQQSVVRSRAEVPRSYASPRASVPTTGRASTPGPLRRARFAPGPRF